MTGIMVYMPVPFCSHQDCNLVYMFADCKWDNAFSGNSWRGPFLAPWLDAQRWRL
jgi:hypothetical protein